jgi:hypothetical protein
MTTCDRTYDNNVNAKPYMSDGRSRHAVTCFLNDFIVVVPQDVSLPIHLETATLNQVL